MTPRVLLRLTSERFRLAGVPDPEVDGALLLSFLTGRSPLSLRLDQETEIDQETLHRFEILAVRRIRREPLQYILQEAPFCGYIFHVDPRVLIPRPETELLCEWAQDILSVSPAADVLDLCCGSGCLGILLKVRQPAAFVCLSDISADALDVARSNASLLHADVCLRQGDLFSALPDMLFDLIVSNPPYIPAEDCRTLQPEVLREPLSALDGGPDGLAFYRRITREAPSHLRSGGWLLMELGDDEADTVASFMKSAGFTDIEIRNDYQSLPRMIGGRIS